MKKEKKENNINGTLALITQDEKKIILVIEKD